MVNIERDETVKQKLKTLNKIPPNQFSDPDYGMVRKIALAVIIAPIIILFTGLSANLNYILWTFLIFFLAAVIGLLTIVYIALRVRGVVRIGMHTIDGKFVDVYAKPTPSGFLNLKNYGAYVIDHSCGRPASYAFPFSIGQRHGIYYEYYQGNPLPLKPSDDALVPEKSAFAVKAAIDNQFAVKIHNASREAEKHRSTVKTISAIAIGLMVVNLAITGWVMYENGKIVKVISNNIYNTNTELGEIRNTLDRSFIQSPQGPEAIISIPDNP